MNERGLTEDVVVLFISKDAKDSRWNWRKDE